MGFDHIQIPFVQGLIVGPTLNADILFKIRLAKKDFPLIYGPVIDKTEIFLSLIDSKIPTA